MKKLSRRGFMGLAGATAVVPVLGPYMNVWECPRAIVGRMWPTTAVVAHEGMLLKLLVDGTIVWECPTTLTTAPFKPYPVKGQPTWHRHLTI